MYLRLAVLLFLVETDLIAVLYNPVIRDKQTHCVCKCLQPPSLSNSITTEDNAKCLSSLVITL